MRSAPVPLIPFLGMYLTDLTYAEEGNPVFMNGKINFTRNIIVAGIINELLNYQRVAHNIAPAMPVLQYLDVQLRYGIVVTVKLALTKSLARIRSPTMKPMQYQCNMTQGKIRIKKLPKTDVNK